MKKAYIIHGWGGNPHEKQLVWLKDGLENSGFAVSLPVMPDSENPVIKNWVDKLNEIIVEDDPDIFLVGHSIGCQAILRFLEQSQTAIRRVVLIAPWFILKEDSYESPEERVIAAPWISNPINFARVVKNCADFVAIFSDDDYFVEIEPNSKILREKLNAKIVIEKNMKHFSEGDGVIALPSVLREIIK